MKILHWDEMFHPSFGYQINVLPKYQAKKGHEVIIFTSDKIAEHPAFKEFSIKEDIKKLDLEYSLKYGIKIERLPVHATISGRVIYKKGFIKKIIDEKPDIIMCHTNDTISSILIALYHRKIKIPLVFDNHMLEMASKNPFNKLFRFVFKHTITKLIIKNRWIVIKTQDDDYINKRLGIPLKNTPFISFGTDRSIFYKSDIEKKQYRNELGISDGKFVVIYAGKLTEPKGGKFLANALKNKFLCTKEVLFLIIGNSGCDDYGKEVEEIFAESENEILRLNTQTYLNLHKFYKLSDIAVYPKQASLSFYDVQSCGLPVILEENEINIKRLDHGNGFAYRTNDIVDFRHYISVFIEMGDEEFSKYCFRSENDIIQKYDYCKIEEEYTAILQREYERYNEVLK